MDISEVSDTPSGSFGDSTPLSKGEKITIQAFNVKHNEEYDSDVAEISTTNGLRYTYAKAIVGQAKSPWWNEKVADCVKKDAADGLTTYVIEREAEGTGRAMLALTAYKPKGSQS